MDCKDIFRLPVIEIEIVRKVNRSRPKEASLADSKEVVNLVMWNKEPVKLDLNPIKLFIGPSEALSKESVEI